MLSNLIRNLFRDKRAAPQETVTAADAGLLKAQDLLKHNLFQEALEAITPVLARQPDLPEAHFIRGTACLELQRNEEGKRALQRAVDLSVQYAQEREQFGRPIAMYQAVKHHCANMAVASELATSAMKNPEKPVKMLGT